MFDISFAELIVIGIVALIVIGPERLPTVARTAGYFLGRARRYVNQVKHELHEEMELDELRKLRNSMQETVDTFENSVRTEINKIQETVNTDTQPATTPEALPTEEKPVKNTGTTKIGATTSSPAPETPRQPGN
ncbi:Sec-independent protein translocase protein TatB [Nitrosomonas sp.]|uniref:Sec-independent protein translocase protein TatB n=1 Tax=Nitrosomonas sp. TaxID=42353 RepID=UPI0025E70170|nr:Sec-independent protein translocase protein TatB [Nitrosomonas sp.]